MAINNSAPLITAIPISPNASSKISRRRIMCKPRRVHFDPVAGVHGCRSRSQAKGPPVSERPPCGASAIREGIANPSPRPSAKLHSGVALDAPIRFPSRLFQMWGTQHQHDRDRPGRPPERHAHVPTASGMIIRASALAQRPQAELNRRGASLHHRPIRFRPRHRRRK
jgi:hypothetical protein